MKKLGCLAAISLFSTVYASELDIQKGQWAAELDNINFNFKSGGSTRTFSDDTQSKTGSVDFNYTIRGRYAVSNKLNLRLETSYSSEKDYQQSPGETSKQWEDAKTDSSLSPAVELFVSDDLALLGGISLSADSNGEAKGFRFKYFGGVLFTKDITPTLLFASENVVIHDNDLNAPSGWNDTTSGISYLRFGTVNQA